MIQNIVQNHLNIIYKILKIKPKRFLKCIPVILAVVFYSNKGFAKPLFSLLGIGHVHAYSGLNTQQATIITTPIWEELENLCDRGVGGGKIHNRQGYEKCLQDSKKQLQLGNLKKTIRVNCLAMLVQFEGYPPSYIDKIQGDEISNPEAPLYKAFWIACPSHSYSKTLEFFNQYIVN